MSSQRAPAQPSKHRQDPSTPEHRPCALQLTTSLQRRLQPAEYSFSTHAPLLFRARHLAAVVVPLLVAGDRSSWKALVPIDVVLVMVD